ncbi:MAG: 2-phosphosulfolactate phosphatase [Gemmatimonadales bacterium]|nr:MAG: 2-phosphosulfolactate phosphatase [Gemmatimonadales bacterium]
MRIETHFSATEAEDGDISGRTAVVIDVIRATSVIVEALASGARAIYPTLTTEDAIRLANSLGREDTLLCGERKGLKVEGFDLGNSPREFTPEAVADRRLVMSTTNGTRAFLAAHGADRVIALSFLNLAAVADTVGDAGSLALICAGKEGRFSLDDALCAGLLIRTLTRRIEDGTLETTPPELNDQSTAALSLARAFSADVGTLERTAAGQALLEVGLGADLPVCVRHDRHDLVPEMHDRMIRIPAPGRATGAS